jgi:tetratricopeptide (TPR) repeat protein
MATILENSKRRLVPRWHSFADAIATGELDPHGIQTAKQLDVSEFITEKARQWETNKTLLFATDFVGAAYVLGALAPARQAAEFILAPESGASPLAKKIASSVLGIPAPPTGLETDRRAPDHRSRIHVLRQRSIAEPRNAFVWVDLALLYTTLGMREQAARVIHIALALAPQDRFVLRCASRFLVHIGDPERAHDILRRSVATPADPWLLAAELAVSSILDKSSRFTKPAQQLLAGNNVPPLHLSELAGALASAELWSGNSRRAGKLFNQSLIQPTENALAQGVWASRDVSIEQMGKVLQAQPNANEAQTLSTFWAGRWTDSVAFSVKWAQDEPFSTRPFLHGSFLASSALENPSEGERIARLGLRVNPHDPGLLNNLAFSLVGQGKPTEAKEAIREVPFEHAPEHAKICLLATRGLIEYRLGRPAEGKQLYQEAISKAAKLNLVPLKARAMLYLAREEALSTQANFEAVLKDAIREISRINNPELHHLSAMIENAIQQHLVRTAIQESHNHEAKTKL